jgi:Ca2+-binding RTX toxin-like protein
MPRAGESPEEMRGSGSKRALRPSAALAAFVALLLLGLVYASALEALRPLCGGRRASIATNDRTIRGTRGPDVIVAGRGANRVFGAGGNDVICGGRGRDEIYGGRGNDTIDGKKDADLVQGGRGSDEVDGGANRDEVRGDSGNDAVLGGPGNRDEVDGGPGDDSLAGGRGGFDVIVGGIGRDKMDGGPGRHDVALYGSAGGAIAVDLANGIVSGAEQERLAGIEDVVGGTGDDLLASSERGPNRLAGGPGDDRLLGTLLRDQAFGGPGDDECLGSFGVVESCGAADGGGAPRVELYENLTGSDDLAIAGSSGDDVLRVGMRGRRFVVGGGRIGLGEPRYAGGCRLSGSAISCAGRVGAILVALGPGNDRIDFKSSLPDDVAVTVDGGIGADRLQGGPGRDTLYGGDDADPERLEGAGGHDALFGVNILHPRRPSGAATMLGGPGSDLMIGGQPCGGDLFHGGGGANDSASFSRVRNEGLYVEAQIGGPVSDPDAVACGAGRIAGSTEKIEGSPGPDVLRGSAGADSLLGRGGADLLDSRGGPDRCVGGRGADRLRHCEDAW